jgi:hypothetical protein
MVLNRPLYIVDLDDAESLGTLIMTSCKNVHLVYQNIQD